VEEEDSGSRDDGEVGPGAAEREGGRRGRAGGAGERAVVEAREPGRAGARAEGEGARQGGSGFHCRLVGGDRGVCRWRMAGWLSSAPLRAMLFYRREGDGKEGRRGRGRVDGEIDGVGDWACTSGHGARGGPKKREAGHVKRADACWARRELARCGAPCRGRRWVVLGWAAACFLVLKKVRIALRLKATRQNCSSLTRAVRPNEPTLVDIMVEEPFSTTGWACTLYCTGAQGTPACMLIKDTSTSFSGVLGLF
jgi:hypothetical protein